MFDRATLRAAAGQLGDTTPDAMRRRLRDDHGIHIGRMTAWRLWNGAAVPSTTTAVAVETAYGVQARDLLVPADGAA